MPTFCTSRAPLAQRRIGGNAGAQQRRDSGRIEIFRHSQYEVLIHHQIGGVAAVGHGAGLAVLTVIGAGKAVLAILFQPSSQLGQLRQESTMQPTPTRSPTR